MWLILRANLKWVGKNSLTHNIILDIKKGHIWTLKKIELYNIKFNIAYLPIGPS